MKFIEVQGQDDLFADDLQTTPAPVPQAKFRQVEPAEDFFADEDGQVIPITAPTRARRGNMGESPLAKPRPDHLLDTPSLKHDRGETKEINGKWYMRLKRSGNIVNLDEDDPKFGVPTDDPIVLDAFGKTQPTKDAIQEIARQKVMDEAMPRGGEPKQIDYGTFMNSLLQSAGPQNLELTGHTLGAFTDISGDDTWAKDADDLIRLGTEGAKAYKAPPVRELKDIGGIGDAWEWTKAMAGQGMGSTIVPFAGGVIGGGIGRRIGGRFGATVGSIGGALGGSASLNIGSMRKTLIEEGVKDPKLRGKVAVVGGVAMASLDSLLPGEIAEKFTGGVRREVEKAIAKRILKGLGKGSLKEGLTEGAQGAVEEIFGKVAAEKAVDPWKLLDTVVENAAGGAVGGALMGAGGGLAPAGSDNARLDASVAAEAARRKAAGIPQHPNRQAKGDRGPVKGEDAWRLMKGAGYTLEDIRSMSPEQYAQTLEELRQQGAEPAATAADTGPPKPPPGEAPMAPHGQKTTGPELEAAEPTTAEDFPQEAPPILPKPTQDIAETPSNIQESASDIAPTPDYIALPSGGKLVPVEDGASLFGDGTKAKPVTVDDAADLDGVREQVNPEPTQGQIDAGTYKKAHIKLRNLPGREISIETAAGGTRRSKAKSPVKWEAKMEHDYGHVLGTKGADGDPIDMFIGPNPGSDRAFVIYQQDPDTGKFDEHKVVAGVDNEEQAREVYESGFSDGKGEKRIQSVEEMDMSSLDSWLDNPTIPQDQGSKPAKAQVEPISSEKTNVPAVKEQLSVRVGNKSFPTDSFEKASEAYRATIDELGIGASGTPSAVIVNDKGEEVARISYNGKVWPPGEWTTDMKPLYSPGGDKPKAESVKEKPEPVKQPAAEDADKLAGKPLDSLKEKPAPKAETLPVPLAEVGRLLKKADLKPGMAIVVEVGAPLNPKAIASERRRATVDEIGDDVDLTSDGRTYTITGMQMRNGIPRFYEDKNPPTAEEIDETEEAAPVDGKLDPLVIAFRDRLLDPDGGFTTITEARAFAAERGFVKGEDADNKVLEEKIELAVVLAARDIVAATRARGRSVGLAYDRLVDLYKRQPKLGTRTSKSMAEQAYSTPAPIAFLASRIAGVDQAKSVLEPTAGNGMLLMEADPTSQKVLANEIDSTRSNALKTQGFSVLNEDATGQVLMREAGKRDVILMNPPFGAVLGESGRSTQYSVPMPDGAPNWQTTRIDYAIALNALSAMAEDGQAVLILGGPAKTALSPDGQKEFYRAKAQREFHWRLGQSYKVVDHFTIRGELYARQGAGWPIDVIVIAGKGKSERPLPGVTPPPIFDSFEALKEKLHGHGFDRERGGPPATPDPVQSEPATSDEGSSQPSRTGGSPAPQSPDLEPVPVRDGRGDKQPGLSGDRRNTPRGEDAESGARPDDRTVDRPSDPEQSPPRLAKPVSTQPESGETALQRKYEPSARSAPSLGALVPANMQTATQDALAAIGEDVDSFVARNLKYREDNLKNHFAAEQIDAIALAIKEYRRGGALILGDQTGQGKGRVVAAMIRYALIQGQVPVFLTQSDDLYGDMYRDMNDIGLPKFLGREVGIFATNTGIIVPLDDEAVDWKGEYDEAKKTGETAPKRRGTFLKTGTAESVKKSMADATAESVPGYDVVFTTYNQTNTVKGADTERRAFLYKMMPNAFLILDEAHNAGGGDTGWGSDKGPLNRADFIRAIVETAKGVMYSSATYAKRPDVMDLYRRTDMAKAVKNIEDLGETIAKGGVPLQQITAAMLAQQGQYIRRERSFEGIEYALTEVDVDREVYNAFSSSLRAVQQFDLAAQEEIGEVMDDLLAEQGLAISKDPSVGVMGASQTGFSSVMHNLVNQMLLAIKVDGAVLEAIQILERGEKPTIALSSTMESFVDQYAEDAGLKVGDAINLTFKDALKRYLDRSLRITVKNHDKTTTHIQVPLEKMPGNVRALYARALDVIEDSGIENLPISPIDAIRNGIEKAGYKVREITGRKRVIDYSGKVPRLKARDPGEMGPAGKRVSVKMYNDGKTDLLIFNRSGSTGVSMHAGPKFKDQRKRVMLVVQAEGNIDTHMQTLGRTNRTGQVVLPSYKQLAAKIPAEARPAAVLLRKMASLNASTTASRKGALNDESIVDFINQYGDQVVYDLMEEHGDLHANMNFPLKDMGNDRIPGAAAKVTGKMTLLNIDEQEMLLDAIAKNYKSLIEQLDATGENMLEAKSLDLQAKPMAVKEMKPRTGASVFEDGIYAEWSSVKADGKSYGGTELVRALADEVGESNITKDNRVERWREIAAKMKTAHDFDEHKEVATNYAKATIAAVKDPDARNREAEKQRELYRRFYGLFHVLEPGSIITIKGKEGGADQQAVVIWTRRTGAGKNPIGLGSWDVKLAMPSSYRTLTIPLSQLYTPAYEIPEGGKGMKIDAPQTSPQLMEKVLEAYDDASKSGREDRWIFTGNLLGGFEMVGKGQVINFTSDDGRLRQGVMMPKEWDMADFNKKRPIEFGTAEQVGEFLDRAQDKAIMSRDGLIDLIISNYGRQIEIAASRALGGKYFLNPAVRRATDDKLTKAGSKVRWQTQDRAAFQGAIKALIDAGARFQTTNEQDLALSIVNPKDGPPEGPGGGGFRSAQAGPRPAQAPMFYSGVLDTVQNSKQAKASARQWLGMIRNAPGVKKEELEWLNLEEWLAAKGDEPVKRHDVAEFVRANQIDVQETVYSDLTNEEIREYHDLSQEVWDNLTDKELQELRREANDTQYTDDPGLQMPGGKNYKELILRLPPPSSWYPGRRDSNAQIDKAYFTDHWRGLPNPIAHVRFNERTDAEGGRVLFIEEVQSDWHQQGRKKGYRGQDLNAEEKELQSLNATSWRDNDTRTPADFDRQADLEARVGSSLRAKTVGVPDAPFKTSWPELAMKRMIRWAAEQGFDRIAWTPGEVQADRYDLSKRIKTLEWKWDGQEVEIQAMAAFGQGDEPISMFRERSELDEAVGKDMADKINAEIDAGKKSATYTGLELQMGGEAMRSFYDRELVNIANKLGKRFGAKVGRTAIETTSKFEGGVSGEMVMNDMGIPQSEHNIYWGRLTQPQRDKMMAEWVVKQGRKKHTDVHSLDVTPEMLHSVMTKGQSVFDARTTEQVERLTDAEAAKIKADIADMAEKILGHRIKVVLMSTYSDGRWGEYDSDRRIIFVAIEAARGKSTHTLAHEMIHAFRDTGIITKPEWGVLKRWAETHVIPSAWWQQRSKDWTSTYDKWGFGLGGREELMAEEAVAEAFAEYMTADPSKRGLAPVDGMVAAIFQKLRLFIERLRAYLEGAGFRIAEEIFADLAAGKMRDRPMSRESQSRPAWKLEPRLTEIPTVQRATPDDFRPAQPPKRRRMPPSRNTARTFMEPEDSAIAVLTNRNLPLLTRVSGGMANAFAPVRRAVQDRMIHWRRVQEAIEQQLGPLNPSDDVYRTETLMAGRAGERLEDFRMDDLDPLVEEMAELDVTKEELDEYLVANHAPERNAYIATINPRFPDGGSGMMTAEAQNITANARPEVVQVARRVYRMLDETRDRLLREGIIDQATYDQWKKQYQYYVPLKGFEADPEEGARLSQGTRYDSRARVTEAALGRSSMADSPLAYTIAGAQQSIILAEKARVGRAVLRLARRYPNTNLWEVNQVVMKRYISKATGLVTSRPDNQKRVLAENVLAVRVGGNLYWVTLHHQGLAAGVKGMDAPSVNAIFRYLINFNRYLALVRTGWDPQFFIPNFLRDVQTAGIHLSAEQGARLAGKIAADIPRAMRGAWRGSRGNLTGPWANFYREFAQAGGKVGIWGLEDIETIKKKVGRQLRRAKGGPVNRFILGATWARQAMEDVNGAIENAVRLSTYVNMRRAGYSQDEAAYAAKEVTVNFNRKGEWSTAINTMYLFANASIQGTSRVAMVLAKSKLARRVAMALFVTGVVQDLINSALSGAGDDDDEDAYDAIPEHVRERNLIFMVPGGPKGEHIKIPMPWVYNVFHYAGTNVGRYLRGKVKGMEAATNLGAAVLQAANPVQSASWLQMAMPTFLDPWVDLYVNEDWKGDPIMPEQSAFEKVKKPDSQLHWENVSPWYKGTTDFLNSVTGGDEVRPGAIDVSPESVEYISDFLFGGVKMTVDQIATTATKIARGEEIEMDRVPFTRKVFGRESPQTGRDEYYDMRDAVALTNAQFEKAVEQGDQALIDQLQRDYPADLKAGPLFDEFDKLLKKLNKARKAAPDSEKREEIRVKMDEIRAKARKAYRQLQKGSPG